MGGQKVLGCWANRCRMGRSVLWWKEWIEVDGGSQAVHLKNSAFGSGAGRAS